MNRTKIEYLDYTLNIIIGCNGEGCAVREKCYARGQEKRHMHECELCYKFIPHIHRERLKQALLVKKAARIGINFTGDTFDRDVHPDWQDELLQMMKQAEWHTFILLTKQPQNIPQWFYYEMPENLRLGVTVNNKNDLWRINTLRQGARPDTLLFMSAEPLYEDITPVDLLRISWVIIGGQTRPKKTPSPVWVNNLFLMAKEQGAAVFLKNNLYPENAIGKIQEYPKI